MFLVKGFELSGLARFPCPDREGGLGVLDDSGGCGCLGCWCLRALASTCVDLSVTQFTSRTWGVHAVLPDGLLSLAGMRV
jgi:hypothetical protein